MDHRDIVEIQQLLALYGHAVDAPDQSLLPLVFTDDAVFDTRDCAWKLYEGLPAITAWFAEGKPPHPPSHHMTNPWIQETDGQVRARSKFLFLDPQGRPCSGDYDDLVVRTARGWRIKHRVAAFRYYPGAL